jgi:PhzF family phenazine biosynthesis protein
MEIYHVDAFTNQVFGGNPAAVCPLDHWISDLEMQQIAMENNLSETAFFVKKDNDYFIRWFTPEIEIDLCGHATLASAHVIYNHLNYKEEVINFQYGGGNLSVCKKGDLLSMDFPSIHSDQAEVSDLIISSVGKKPNEAYKARDLMIVFNSENDIKELEPDFAQMANIDVLGVIATAPGDKVDFVSRFFAPNAGINEDPVTGSAHCMLIPFWAKRLRKNDLSAMQLSKRVGELTCLYKGDRVEIAGQAITYLIGEIY